MYQTNEFKKGLKIEYNDKPWVIVDAQFVSPGKGGAFTRTKLKNLETGQVVDITFKSGETVKRAEIEQRSMQYLYNDGTHFTFMDNESFDQLQLSHDDLGDARYFIVENSVASVTFYKGRAIGVEVDNFVILEVTETQPNIKGDTSGGGGKPATLSTGLTISVPFHINQGEFLKVDTRTKSYVEKVKG